MKIPYKTNGKSKLLEPKSEKGLQNHQKSIGFFTINHMVFPHVSKPYKTNGKLMILTKRKTQKSPIGVPSRFFILHPSSFILHPSPFILHPTMNQCPIHYATIVLVEMRFSTRVVHCSRQGFLSCSQLPFFPLLSFPPSLLPSFPLFLPRLLRNHSFIADRS